jgi:uncharacterized protein YutE (UPF0331/DUF86 family)
MTSEARVGEENVLENLRQTYEVQGFKFYRNPSSEIIPAFLRGYVPDAIALDDRGGGIIIEVKQRRSGAVDRQLAQVAQKIAPHKGWEFRAVFTNPVPGTSLNIPKPTTEQIDAKIREIQTLAQSQHYDAALVVGWAILESLARSVTTDNERERSRGLTPIQAVQTLAQEGYLENDAAQRLREMADLRNAVAHGNLSAIVSPERVRDLLEQLQAVASGISQTNSNHAIVS